MTRSRIVVGLVTVFGLTGLLGMAFAEEGEASAPPHTIKEVMKLAHKDGLLKKVLADDATQEEKLKLLDLYVSMYEGKPSKGETESWHRYAGASVLAAAKVAAGRDALPELKKATACAGCHKAHKGD